jgi:hypothetical protein
MSEDQIKQWIEKDSVDYANEMKGKQVSFATIYDAACNRLYSHLKSQMAGVWVSCVDRLPEKMKQVNGRLNGRPAIVCNSRLVDGFVTANGNLERCKDVEWLDESGSEQLAKKDEEIAELKNGFGVVDKLLACVPITTHNYYLAGFNEHLEYWKEFKKTHNL